MDFTLHVDGAPKGSKFVYTHPRTGAVYSGRMNDGDFFADENPETLVVVYEPPPSSMRLVRKALPEIDVLCCWINPWLPAHYECGGEVVRSWNADIDFGVDADGDDVIWEFCCLRCHEGFDKPSDWCDPSLLTPAPLPESGVAPQPTSPSPRPAPA